MLEIALRHIFYKPRENNILTGLVKIEIEHKKCIGPPQGQSLKKHY